ncbi:Lipopolysaccharide biosynthesis protein, LPS:glycosyltransferase [Polaribacter sp. KT25b]|uniref:glycosyltransferase family 8 protein n=1 Tax=Polaribacter sp. KT25b TaxID=1855336 RepID=UPI00087D2772|nr:glycosyltransferase family 8 protein [Polaribacter sp. KT25b]SDS26599.1 Lipopolysaccharide biosynthesis protein, LPS:glycosyltransferase [Polaribacter sp. KT25b]
MNIVLATDDNFVQHCSVTIVSVAKNNPNVTFYILTEGLNSENQILLNNLGVILNIIKINRNVLNKFPMPDDDKLSHISLATYYRLLISSLLPIDVHKIIYLDCDIVVRKNIYELWNEDISKFAMAAVFQIARENIESISRLGYSIENGYFNAGVLLINLDYWRNNNVESQLIDFISNYHSRIVFHDQDTLNAVLHSKVKELSCRWNMLSSYFKLDVHKIINMKVNGNMKNISYNYSKEILSEILDPTIIHFVSRPKPWSRKCYHPYMYEYYVYLSKIKNKLCFPNSFDYFISRFIYIAIKSRVFVLLVKKNNG